MKIKTAVSILAIGLATLSGCASVPMATQEKDAASKTFASPPANQAGLYVFRNSALGAALRKTVSIDGAPIGKTAPNTYFHRIISPGAHTLSTEVPSVFRLPKGGFHATSFSFCCSLSQISMN